MNDYNMEQLPLSGGLSQSIYVSHNLPLIELDSYFTPTHPVVWLFAERLPTARAAEKC